MNNLVDKDNAGWNSGATITSRLLIMLIAWWFLRKPSLHPLHLKWKKPRQFRRLKLLAMLGEVSALPICSWAQHYGYSASYEAVYWLVASGQVIYKWHISTRVHAVAERRLSYVCSPGAFHIHVVVPAGYNCITIQIYTTMSFLQQWLQQG